MLKVQDALLTFLEDSAVFGPLLFNAADDFDESDFEPGIIYYFNTILVFCWGIA